MTPLRVTSGSPAAACGAERSGAEWAIASRGSRALPGCFQFGRLHPPELAAAEAATEGGRSARTLPFPVPPAFPHVSRASRADASPVD